MRSDRVVRTSENLVKSIRSQHPEINLAVIIALKIVASLSSRQCSVLVFYKFYSPKRLIGKKYVFLKRDLRVDAQWLRSSKPQEEDLAVIKVAIGKTPSAHVKCGNSSRNQA
jgi:hypothetical protein